MNAAIETLLHTLSIKQPQAEEFRGKAAGGNEALERQIDEIQAAVETLRQSAEAASQPQPAPEGGAHAG